MVAWCFIKPYRSFKSASADQSHVNRSKEPANATTGSRYSVIDPRISRLDPANSDIHSSPMARAQASYRPLNNRGSQGFLGMPNAMDEDDDDFGSSMFDDIGSEVRPIPPPPRVARTVSVAEEAHQVLTLQEFETQRPTFDSWRTPEKNSSPLAYRRPEADLSPYSQDSRTSRDGLLSSPVSIDNSPSRRPLPPSRFSRMPDSLMEDLDRLAPPPIMRRTESSESFTRSPANEDADAAIVRKSVISQQLPVPVQPQQKSQYSPGPYSGPPLKSSLKPPADSVISNSDASTNTLSMSSSSSLGMLDDAQKRASAISASTTPRPSIAPVSMIKRDDQDVLSGSLQTSARNRLSQPPSSRQTISPVPSSVRSVSQESVDHFGNPTRSAMRNTPSPSMDLPKPAILRESSPVNNIPKRQSVVFTEDTIGGQEARPAFGRASQSAPNLLVTKPPGFASNSPTGDSSDDDDDVPLALLQANMLPSRGTTPDLRLSTSPSMMSLGQRTNTMGTQSATTPRSSLPPFARKIPLTEDVFANSMNNRASMMRPPPGVSPVPGMPPGGLVGVIAEEERFRGIRRAGTAQAGSMHAGMSMGMGGVGPMAIPGMGPGMGAPNYGAMDPTQQVIMMETLQAVQQQNAMMSQLLMHIQTQGSAPASPVIMQEGFAAPVNPNYIRPASVMSGAYAQPQHAMQQLMGVNPHARTQSMVNLVRPGPAPRTMSMIDTAPPFAHGAAPWETHSAGPGSAMGLGLNYAPSVAPSERSLVGQPNRYRPISSGQDGHSGVDGRGSGTLSMNGVPMGVRNMQSVAPTAANVEDARKRNSMLSAVVHPKGRVGEVASVSGEAEEEEDWSSFARRRRQKT
jgi:hypothetical protein